MSSGASGLLGGPTASDGSMQSFYNFLDPGNILGRSNSSDIAANLFDPGNMLGFNPAANPQLNGQAAKAAGSTALTLPAPNGNVNPVLYSPNSFVPRQPLGPGAYNAMAARLAGPVYMPQVQSPSVSATGTTTGAGLPGGVPALAQLLVQRLGGATAMPYNAKLGAMGYAR